MQIFIEGYGCAAEQSDVEIMKGLLMRAGASIVNDPKLADIIIISTCSVKSATEQKIMHRISELAELNKKMIITGCLVDAELSRLREHFPFASFLSTHRITDIHSAVSAVASGKRVELIERKRVPKLCLPRMRQNPLVGIVQISEGCTGSCAYCSTRLAKGELFSYPQELIVKEVCNDVRAGCKEIWLTAQDVFAYGKDIGADFPELLEKVCAIEGKFMIRLGMGNVNNLIPILDRMISIYQNEKIYKFLHLPVQSGSNAILEAMGRKYKVEDWERCVNDFRTKVPRLTLWTDIIVGYPGERDEDFEKSCELISRVKPDYINISRFSSRPGTPASRLKKVPSEIVKERTVKISELVRKIAMEKNREWIGWRGKVLVVDKLKSFIGRNFAYKQVVLHGATKADLGKFLDVRIVDVSPTSLVGEVET